MQITDAQIFPSPTPTSCGNLSGGSEPQFFGGKPCTKKQLDAFRHAI